VVGITNAFNLIDGLDGLAAGVALIASATLWALTRARPRADVSLLAASLVGALAGFLRYNFYPASILLGDSGSMSIGYLLSVLYVAGSREESGEVSILIPFLALGLPITDTLLAVTRRLLKAPSELGGDCERPESHLIFARLVAVFRPDQEHLHHRLLRIGLKHHHAVLLLYFVSTALGLSAFLAANVKPGIGASVIGGAGILAYAALRRLGYLGGRIPVRRLPRRG
jgi:UDP-GlcNAc:undecaprenyl-phosphate GlcNAc-1-phosphate transferase